MPIGTPNETSGPYLTPERIRLMVGAWKMDPPIEWILCEREPCPTMIDRRSGRSVCRFHERRSR